jgi:hypothetical protein
LDLLKYHEKYEEKVKDLKDVSVDIHPKFPNTRCFFIIREDGTKEV